MEEIRKVLVKYGIKFYMQRKEFRLSQLEISDFFIGWNEIASS